MPKIAILSFFIFILFQPASAQVKDNSPDSLRNAEMYFYEQQYNWGEVKEGAIVRRVFKFVNRGNEPLIIRNAMGSCGCTVPFYPSDPVLPGEESEILVEFNSNGRVGAQSKQVTIEANTQPHINILALSGIVLLSDSSYAEEDQYSLKRENDRALIATADSNCFAIFPNPANELLQLELKHQIGKTVDLQITNSTGTRVWQDRIEKVSYESSQIDISNFPEGIYYIHLDIAGEKLQSQCFVISGR